jgi:hypothetical protein
MWVITRCWRFNATAHMQTQSRPEGAVPCQGRRIRSGNDPRKARHSGALRRANRWLQKTGAIVSGLLFTMKIPTMTCGAAKPRSRAWLQWCNRDGVLAAASPS